jgi:hypothetical protein
MDLSSLPMRKDKDSRVLNASCNPTTVKLDVDMLFLYRRTSVDNQDRVISIDPSYVQTHRLNEKLPIINS